MVLVGQRRAEQRHDPVAHHLVHGALVAVDGLHHALEDRVEELARLLGIAVGQQLHRALEVGEEHGDLLALAFQRGLRGQDLLGEVLGRVGLGRGEARLAAGGPASTGWAHSGQNFAGRGSWVPQFAQGAAARALLAELRRGGFSVWHRGHVIGRDHASLRRVSVKEWQEAHMDAYIDAIVDDGRGDGGHRPNVG